MAVKISSREASEKEPVEFSWKMFGVILLLLLIIALPIAITVWDMGAPIKGLSQS